MQEGFSSADLPHPFPMLLPCGLQDEHKEQERMAVSQGLLSPCQKALERGWGLLDVTDSLNQTDADAFEDAKFKSQRNRHQRTKMNCFKVRIVITREGKKGGERRGQEGSQEEEE